MVDFFVHVISTFLTSDISDSLSRSIFNALTLQRRTTFSPHRTSHIAIMTIIPCASDLSSTTVLPFPESCLRSMGRYQVILQTPIDVFHHYFRLLLPRLNRLEAPPSWRSCTLCSVMSLAHPRPRSRRLHGRRIPLE